MCIGQSSSTPTRRCGEFRWLRHGRRPLLQDSGAMAPVVVSRKEPQAPMEALKLSFLRVSGAGGGGIRASGARPGWPEPSPVTLGRAQSQPRSGPGAPGGPGRRGGQNRTPTQASSHKHMTKTQTRFLMARIRGTCPRLKPENRRCADTPRPWGRRICVASALLWCWFGFAVLMTHPPSLTCGP